MSVFYAPQQAILAATTALCGILCMAAYLLAFALGRRACPVLSRPMIGLGELLKPLACGMLLGALILCLQLESEPVLLGPSALVIAAPDAATLLGALLSVGFGGACTGIWDARPRPDQAPVETAPLVRRLCAAGAVNQQATARIAVRLALAAGYDPAGADTLLAAAALHDIGKTGVAAAILHKEATAPGTLDAAEQGLLRDHTRIGFRMLAHSRDPMLELAADIALHHHENWDGTGYPHGLAGQAIPIASRAVALAGHFDTIMSAPTDIDVLTRRIRQHAGTRFDPHLVDLLLDDLPAMIAARGAKAQVRPAPEASSAPSRPATSLRPIASKHVAV